MIVRRIPYPSFNANLPHFKLADITSDYLPGFYEQRLDIVFSDRGIAGRHYVAHDKPIANYLDRMLAR